MTHVQIPAIIQRQMEKQIMAYLIAMIEKVMSVTPEERAQCLEDLKEQQRTGRVREGALIQFRL